MSTPVLLIGKTWCELLSEDLIKRDLAFIHEIEIVRVSSVDGEEVKIVR